ncbi:hypothetical protein D3C76_700870 [compost metagenome]
MGTSITPLSGESWVSLDRVAQSDFTLAIDQNCFALDQPVAVGDVLQVLADLRRLLCDLLAELKHRAAEKRSHLCSPVTLPDSQPICQACLQSPMNLHSHLGRLADCRFTLLLSNDQLIYVRSDVPPNSILTVRGCIKGNEHHVDRLLEIAVEIVNSVYAFSLLDKRGNKGSLRRGQTQRLTLDALGDLIANVLDDSVDLTAKPRTIGHPYSS